MELHLNENEVSFVDTVRQIVGDYLEPPREGSVNVASYSSYSGELRESLVQGGFLAAAREADFGPVCAVLLIEEAAKSPLSAEIATSALVAALATEAELEGPFALARAEHLTRPIRFLPVARTLLVLSGEDLLALPVDAESVEVNGGMFAYPFGTFTKAPELARARHVGRADRARRYWQVGLAAEGAGLMQAALDYTVDYVKNRRQFNRPIGSFQAVKHRLAADAQKVRSAIWLARRAAWSGTAGDAAMAALYTQLAIPPVVYDCHQFNGAMGMTLECPLHFWTYRLKALQGEIGGAEAQAGELARVHWG